MNIVGYLLEKDNKLVYIRTKNGRTPAHTAALHGHLSVLQLILENIECKNTNGVGDILSNKDACGMTPFMDACQADHDTIVRYFVEKFQVFNILVQNYSDQLAQKNSWKFHSKG